MSMKKIAVFIILSSICFISLFLIFREGNLPVDKNSQNSKIFVINKGESLSSIARNLVNEGLIRNNLVFYFTVKRLKIEKNIQAGDFRLSPAMSATEIAKALTHGTLDSWITVVEGLRKEEIAQIISRHLGIPETEFIKDAKEGYLFPDTYLMPRSSTIEAVLSIFNANFQSKYTPEIANKISRLGLTQNQALTIASLTEREARHDADRQIVASIIYKRYKNDWELDIDATIQYALGYQSSEKTWWKKALTQKDMEIDSPYNSYKNPGLPPGPICSPGLASIAAVAEIKDTPYWFYLSDKNGNMHYAKTIEEHHTNISRYLSD